MKKALPYIAYVTGNGYFYGNKPKNRESMENGKRLTRSMDDKWIAGVCGGVAHYFGWDPAIVRLVYLLLTVCTAFCGFLVYIVLWACMPQE